MIQEPEFWKRKNSLISKSLIPLSYLYNIFFNIIKAISKPYISNKTIICVGNLTVGGNGKTPTVCFIAKYFQKLGYKVVIASRGYKGKEKFIHKVELSDSFRMVGDESLILAKIAPCYIGRDKKQLITIIEERENPDIIILDDGLQNYSLKKDFEILVIDGLRGFGNHQLLPAGPLRENIDDRLKTVDHIIFIDEDETNIKHLLEKKVGIVNGKLIPLNVKVKKLLNYVAFAAIGNPKKFFRTLENYNYNLIKTIAYPDHYFYNSKDLEYLVKVSKHLNAKLITTAKDAVKLPIKFKEKIDILEIDLDIDNYEFLEKIALTIG